MAPTIVVSVLMSVLGVYVYLRHRDVFGGAAALMLAAGALLLALRGAERERALRDDLATSRQRIAELETAPAKRGFDAETRARLVRELGEFAGPSAFVLANASDLETTQYAREMANVLKEAGWRVPPSFGMSYQPVLLPGHEGVPKGVILGVSDDVPEQFATRLNQILLDNGVDVVRGPHWPGTEHPISILVGPQSSSPTMSRPRDPNE